jgi:hypothetical protein
MSSPTSASGARAHIGLARSYRILGENDGIERHLQQARLIHAGMPDIRQANIIREEIESTS